MFILDSRVRGNHTQNKIIKAPIEWLDLIITFSENVLCSECIFVKRIRHDSYSCISLPPHCAYSRHFIGTVTDYSQDLSAILEIWNAFLKNQRNLDPANANLVSKYIWFIPKCINITKSNVSRFYRYDALTKSTAVHVCVCDVSGSYVFAAMPIFHLIVT